MAYYTNDGFRLGDRREKLDRSHFGFSEAASRAENESHKDDDSAAVQERDSHNSMNIRDGAFVEVLDVPYAGVIRGIVFDGTTTTGLEDATVTLSGDADATYTTGSDGAFAFESLVAGTYALLVEATGKVDQEEEAITLEAEGEHVTAFQMADD